MAFIQSFFATTVLLFSLLVIASANDYGYYSPKPDNEKPKPEGNDKLPVPTKPDYEKEIKPNLVPTKPEYEKEIKPSPVPTKPDYEKEIKPSPVPTKPDYEKEIKPKSEEKAELLSTSIISIQGLVLCKSPSKYFPLQGALARITCQAVDENGYEKVPFSIVSHITDSKGYFFATISVSELEEKWKLTECKAFLESSPLDTCQVPTDVNKGITGALLSSYHLLNNDNIKLYSVGPFFYTSEPNKPVPDGY
ncbi:Pollen Ole e 1 allergen/extensin [Quillaja saponaria]|uniref:Pollen Ole e 1 allergen/extensin n=1 Tax=Quillaja saponaria TaxID=32244 RepID=A0AAD7Q1E4_QUISA|nr:Pollen Ole e 1 allergen/extensin [Quillaja saponaria]